MSPRAGVMCSWRFWAANIRRCAGAVALLLLICMGAGCESRPPIDVYGHKDSVYQRLVIGMPF